jgi:hypothetical protein
MEQNWDVGSVNKYRLSTEIIYDITVVPHHGTSTLCDASEKNLH